MVLSSLVSLHVLCCESSDAAILVDEAKNTFVIAGGRIDLRIDIVLGLPRVMAHRRRIVQVLGKITSSVSPHSPESSTIRVSTTAEGPHANAAPVQEVLSDRQRRAKEGAQILSVDDSPLTFRGVRDALSKAGYDMVVTGDPEEALVSIEV